MLDMPILRRKIRVNEMTNPEMTELLERVKTALETAKLFVIKHPNDLMAVPVLRVIDEAYALLSTRTPQPATQEPPMTSNREEFEKHVIKTRKFVYCTDILPDPNSTLAKNLDGTYHHHWIQDRWIDWQAASKGHELSEDVKELIDACNAFFNTEVEFPGAENYKLRLDMLEQCENRVRVALKQAMGE